MSTPQKLLVNIFSNWMHLLILTLLSFFVSPIIVHQLGNEMYGIWVLLVSITGYFTVLDFGVNTAIVRFVSMYCAQQRPEKANEIYTTSFVFFAGISVLVILLTIVLGIFLPAWFHLQQLSHRYVYVVFLIVGLDIACSLLFSVLLATLKALQEFFKINVISITLLLTKNLLLVLLLLRGHRLLTMALIQLSINAVQHLLHYLLIHKQYDFLRVRRVSCTREALGQIYHYSLYSFIISIAGRVIFMTDSLVISSLLSVSEVTFYAIPATLLQYVEKFIMAITGVLLPVISSQDAVGDTQKNRALYVMVTKYLLTLSLPVLFVLMTIGDDFIGIWMGAEYGMRSKGVLRILIVGYGFLLPQWIAYGILGGISKHRFLAYLLTLEAVANLGLSVLLAPVYGIDGVALGTTLPLFAVNMFAIPIYTCRRLTLSFFNYVVRAYSLPGAMLLVCSGIYWRWPFVALTYSQVFMYSAVVSAIWAVFGGALIVEPLHRQWLWQAIRTRLHGQS